MKNQVVVVSVMNQKGGVGKTTLTFNLAHGLARNGLKVLVIDNDAQGNLTSSLLPRGVKPLAFAANLYEGRPDNPQQVAENLWLMAGDDELESYATAEEGPAPFRDTVRAIQRKMVFDLILIDTNPQITHLTFAAAMAATQILVPLIPTKFAFEGLGKLFRKIKELKTTGASQARILGFVLTMQTGTTYHRQGVAMIRTKYPELTFAAAIRKLTAYEESPAVNKSIFEYEPNGQAATEMKAVVDEFLARLNGGAHNE